MFLNVKGKDQNDKRKWHTGIINSFTLDKSMKCSTALMIQEIQVKINSINSKKYDR